MAEKKKNRKWLWKVHPHTQFDGKKKSTEKAEIGLYHLKIANRYPAIQEDWSILNRIHTYIHMYIYIMYIAQQCNAEKS